jgi:hypothetical protein
MYVNPIEGVLISYKTPQKFPQQPNIIIPLKSILNIELMTETKWYFSRNCYYLRVVCEEKEHVYFNSNLDVIQFWVGQITQAMHFHEWYQNLITVRYRTESHLDTELVKVAD